MTIQQMNQRASDDKNWPMMTLDGDFMEAISSYTKASWLPCHEENMVSTVPVKSLVTSLTTDPHTLGLCTSVLGSLRL